MNAVVVIDEYAARLHLALKLVKALLVEHHSDVESVKIGELIFSSLRITVTFAVPPRCSGP